MVKAIDGRYGGDNLAKSLPPNLLSSPVGARQLLISKYENINLSKRDVLCDLENEYDQLYQEAQILKSYPKSKEYRQNKKRRQRNIQERDKLLRG